MAERAALALGANLPARLRIALQAEWPRDPLWGEAGKRSTPRAKVGIVMVREIITLACSECKRRNYTTTKDKKLTPDRIELKKYCRFERKHTVHREIR